MGNIDIKKLEVKIKEGYQINETEALELLEMEDKSALYELANSLREYFCGDDFDMCSIINARSGKCSENCKWCSQSKYHSCNIPIYPFISLDECMAMAKNNESKGVRRFSLVTSGRVLEHESVMEAYEIYRTLDGESSMEFCASMGLLVEDQLRALKDNGVNRYHCNIETAPSFFSSLCTTHTIEDKLETINAARNVGMKICSGGIIGMGESREQRVEFAMFLRELDPDSIPLNVLNPIKGTGLEGEKSLTEEEILSTIAIFRVINPTKFIRFAGGRGALGYDAQVQALRCGINGAIVGDMLTTTGDKDIEADKKMFREVYSNF